MSRKCQITGRGPQVGHNVSHAHNLSKRRWNINLQKVRVLVDGQVKRIRVSTKAIKSGLVTRPPIKLKPRRTRELKLQDAKAAGIFAAEDEPIGEFFSSTTMVDRLFKRKPKPSESAEEEELAAETESQVSAPVENAVIEEPETPPSYDFRLPFADIETGETEDEAPKDKPE